MPDPDNPAPEPPAPQPPEYAPGQAPQEIPSNPPVGEPGDGRPHDDP
jgi:hypothetical protein